MVKFVPRVPTRELTQQHKQDRSPAIGDLSLPLSTDLSSLLRVPSRLSRALPRVSTSACSSLTCTSRLLTTDCSCSFSACRAEHSDSISCVPCCAALAVSTTCKTTGRQHVGKETHVGCSEQSEYGCGERNRWARFRGQVTCNC